MLLQIICTFARVCYTRNCELFALTNFVLLSMKNLISLIVIVLLILTAVWFFSEKDDHHHDDDHGHEAQEIKATGDVRADGTFSIAASFYPLAFALETLTDGVAEVTNVGEGRDPHDVQLSTADVATLQTADLVVLQGAELEPWGDDIIAQLTREDVPVLIATAGFDLMEGGHDDHGDEDEHEEEGHHDEDEDEHEEEGHHDEHGAFDPHTWLDPVLFAESIEEMVHALETLDPENAALYEARGETLITELTAIDAEYATRLSTCAADEVITSHDAFGYLGERYEFEIHAVTGFSTQDLPSAQTLAELREEAEEGVSAILLEENSIAAYGQTLANETGLRTLSVNPITYVIPEGEDYLSIMRTNLEVFGDALECS